MKKLISILFFVLILASGFFGYKKVLPYFNRWINFSFCDQPILYRVEAIDPKFKISKDEIISNTKAAADLWNNIIGKKVFVYDDSATLSISLVFDERQETLNNIKNLTDQVEDQKKDLSLSFDEYEKRKSDLEAQVRKLNNEIESWNEKGGAPKEIYEQIILKQKILQTRIEDINKQAERLNMTTDKINQKISVANTTVKEFNSLLNIKPEEGLYIGSEQKIEIYIYESNKNFINTTAHELGHALGLSHSDNTDAIMAPIAAENVHVTSSDKDQIKNYCVQQNRIELIKNDIKNILYSFFAKIQIVGNMDE